MPDFRPCATCESCSQAPILPMCSKADFHPARGDLWTPPLPFRRRPPQSNYPPGTVPGKGLETRPKKSGISRAPRPEPKLGSQRVPPILRIKGLGPMPSCSKAPRGLFVLSREMSICTHTSISPGPSLRQCPDRYAIRAGRNLPDKEFRYLRTVIVTAAVHRGFGSEP